jgi:methyl-accepting chemotaxis protein
MRRSWTFSRKLALGFAVIVVAFAIELSTKQQASAVEQVHVAIAGLAQTTRETEAGATQTLQTSSQLTSLSTSLTRLVQAT